MLGFLYTRVYHKQPWMGFEMFKALVALFLTDWVYVEAAYDEARTKS